MRDYDVDLWPQVFGGPKTPRNHRLADLRSSVVPDVLYLVGLVAAIIGVILILALVVAPSAGAAGGCGGG
jgi:hypothetical protein